MILNDTQKKPKKKQAFNHELKKMVIKQLHWFGKQDLIKQLKHFAQTTGAGGGGGGGRDILSVGNSGFLRHNKI